MMTSMEYADYVADSNGDINQDDGRYPNYQPRQLPDAMFTHDLYPEHGMETEGGMKYA